MKKKQETNRPTSASKALLGNNLNLEFQKSPRAKVGDTNLRPYTVTGSTLQPSPPSQVMHESLSFLIIYLLICLCFE